MGFSEFSMINKKSVAIILAALNLTLLGCAYDSAEAPQIDDVLAQGEPLNNSGALSLSDMNEMLLYESPQYGIDLSYPADWIAQEPDINDAGIIVGFLAPGEDIDNPAIYLLVQNEKLPTGQDITLEQYGQAAMRTLEEAMPDLNILTESDITIGEIPGHGVVYSLNSQNMTFTVLKAWTVIGEDAYIFTYSAPDEFYELFAGDVSDMIDSFDADTFSPDAENTSIREEVAAAYEEPNLVEEENTSITY